MGRTLPVTITTIAALALLAPSAQGQERFALQMFHFNVQYVCGGTIGFLPSPDPEFDLDNDTLEDRIITESFAPVVELFERHPSWGVDLEMQGYMLDVIAERHPELLAKLRAMAQAGQIDILSFHYGDQLFIAYPQQDWLRSQELTAATFAEHDVPLSPSVFCQEGQAGMGLAPRMAERGYQTMVWPKNLWIYQHGEFEAAPLYRFGDVFLIAGAQGVSTAEVEMTWTFFDDGELLATGDTNPYFVEQFWHDPEKVAEYETELLGLEAEGYRIATVRQYVDAVQGLVTPADPPPLLDGTWQPKETLACKRWLGGGGAWTQQERDNHVRTLGAQAHRELIAAETVAAQAELDARSALDAAWRLLALGQVSDATGLNPFRGEVEYGISHLAEVLRISRAIIVEGKGALGLSEALIDPVAGTVEAAAGRSILRGAPAEPPTSLDIQAGDRPVTESWEQIAPGHHRVAITFGSGEDTILSVRFPGATEDDLTLTLALLDDQPATLQRSAFTFEEFHLALPVGLVSLGGGRFVIKDQGNVHLAARITRDSGDVSFGDETVRPLEVQHWVFHLFEGTPEEAVELARQINGQRRLVR